MTEDLNDDFMQFMIDQMNKGYSEYKKNHPDFAKVVEEQLEGKTEEEFERQFSKNQTCPHCGEHNYRDEIINGCCHECGKWFY